MEIEDMALAVLDEPLAPAFIVEVMDFNEVLSLALCPSENLALVRLNDSIS